MKLLMGLLLTYTMGAFAEVSVMFHPFDPTLKTIAHHIEQAQESVEIAMYNIDVTQENPVIAALASPEIQARIQSKDLKIRMLFEGYSAPEANEEKMRVLEGLGIDVRALGQKQKMHHKFAVIDAGLPNQVLISGSANWSLSSSSNYNENILFFKSEPEITYDFHQHFEELWSFAKMFGHDLNHPSRKLSPPAEDLSINAHFNFQNFKLKDGKLKKKNSSQDYVLTRKIVEKINSAESHIQIATTRIKLRPIFDALLAAARRGVKIDILVTMGEYEAKYMRKHDRAPECENPYKISCSASHNFATYLAKENFGGHENIEVRFKFFDLNLKSYLTKQMHSKYMIVDDKDVLSGSFNWSYSAEYNHLENLIELKGEAHPEVLESFTEDFENLFSQNRQKFMPFVLSLEEALKTSKTAQCKFEPMALDLDEIDFLLATPRRAGQSLRGICY